WLSANRLLRPRFGPAMVDRVERDVLATAEATHVVIMAGINDIIVPDVTGEPVPAPEEIVAGLYRLADRARQHGITAVLGTIVPIGVGRLATLPEDIRRAVNRAVTTQNDWRVVDFAAGLAEPSAPHVLAPAYDSGDGLHPNDAGARALAGAIDLDLFRA